MQPRRIVSALASVALLAGTFVAVSQSSANAASRKITLSMNSGTETRFVRGENVWLRGKATAASGRAYKNMLVKVYRYNSRNKAVQIGTTRTSGSGVYTFSMRPSSTAKYRVKIGDVRSRVLRLTQVGSHTLAQRQASLRFILGSPRSNVASSGNLRWRIYQNGVLVQAANRTWVVRGRAATEYRRNGGPTGKLGYPAADARCGLVEGACLQKFRTGAIYTNGKARDKTVAVSSSNRDRAGIAAVALSQRGYKEPSFRKSKYNRWMGRTDSGAAWCAFFTAWTSYAAGEGEAIVKRSSFPATWKAEQKRKRLRSSPAVGRVAYIAVGGGTPHHAGIVIRYDSKYVWLMEGNVDSAGRSSHPRGVHYIKRVRANVKAYADPRF